MGTEKRFRSDHKQIGEIQEGRIQDKIDDAAVEAGRAEGGEGGGDEGGGGGVFGDADIPEGEQLLTAVPSDGSSYEDDEEEDDDFLEIEPLSILDPDAPIKAQNRIAKADSSSRGPLTTHMPDFKKMVTHGRSQDSMKRPYGDDVLKPAFEGMDYDEGDSYSYKATSRPAMTPEMRSVFKSLVNILGPQGGVLLSEAEKNERKESSLEEYEAGEIDES